MRFALVAIIKSVVHLVHCWWRHFEILQGHHLWLSVVSWAVQNVVPAEAEAAEDKAGPEDYADDDAGSLSSIVIMSVTIALRSGCNELVW